MIKVAFLGTPQFSLPFVEAIFNDSEIKIEAIISQPDRKVGRKQLLESPPVAIFAKENSIPLLQPENMSKDNQAIEKLKSLNLDYLIIIAYGQIVSKEVIDCAKLGAINVHPSNLPKYRGPSPIQASLLNGDKKSAVSIMLIDEKMDHGPLLLQEEFEIEENDNYFDIENKVFKIGPELLIKAIKEHSKGILKPKEQLHEEATYCHFINKSDGKINPSSETAEEIFNKFRAYIAWPGIYLELIVNGKEELVKLLDISHSQDNLTQEIVTDSDSIKVQTKSGHISIKRLQIAGKQAQDVSSLIKGIRSLEVV